ncbi:type II secretion system (T2SS) protein F [Actinocorallia herbida]|uniref:Type II secretion system (T2SS) protein F n=1 Tax=Actinocorallia herbida TaxID=58109 RepID=A0A3N1D9C1_9ACTN|nr:type II secretion system F family protein [Actinocorallia herbida]ROO90101.1 type II secretion system (T2SS) protein F [Actinocorallia herbida]
MILGIDVLYALFAGGLACAGLCALVMAVRGTPVKPGQTARKRSREDLLRALGTRTGIAVIAGFAALVLTQWVVVAVGIGLLVLGWDAVAGGAAEERRSMARLEGLANWAESLRDTIAGAVGLEQAIPSSVRAAAPALQPALRALVDRMHTRVPLPEALRRFAEDLDDASADLIIAALMLNARLRGPGLREMLGALAASARTELEMRRRVNAYRAMTRRSVQIVVGFSVGFALLVSVFNPSYVEPYNSFVGQIVLASVVGLYALGFFWLRRLAKFQAPERLLGATDAEPAETGRPLRGRAAMDAGVGR